MLLSSTTAKILYRVTIYYSSATVFTMNDDNHQYYDVYDHELRKLIELLVFITEGVFHFLNWIITLLLFIKCLLSLIDSILRLTRL